MTTQDILLVTGASGQLGQLVLEQLAKITQSPVIATTRNPEKLSALAQGNVSVRAADFNDPDSLSSAFEGATRLLLISTDAIGSRIQQHQQAIDAAVKAGVKHIIYTSWPNAETSPAGVAPEHAATEAAILASGLSYTILRNYIYADSLFDKLKHAVASGTLIGAAGEAKTAYVTRLDCARAAAAALSSSSTENQILNISGPKAYSYADIAEVVSALTGKTVQYINVSDAELKAGLQSSGLPEIWADLITSFDTAFRNGDATPTSSAVEDLTGAAASDLADFLKANLSAFAS